MRRFPVRLWIQLLRKAAAELSVDEWGYTGPTGLHLAVEFPGARFDQEFIKRCRKQGIWIASVESHSIQKGFHLDKLLLGYGHLETDEIEQGLLLLHTLF